MRRLSLYLLTLLSALWPVLVFAQVVPGPGGGVGLVTLPETICVNQVATALSAQGVLACNPVTPAMAPGLVPAGVDVSALGQVLATHLVAPLPLAQGGLGLSSGNTGGLPYFSSSSTVASTPTLPQHAPLFGGGAGAGPEVGTRSGTTLEVATVAGPHQVGKQLAFDAQGNITASAFDVGAAGGGGGAVASVFGRTGTVLAQPGDYTAAQVTNAADRSVANVFTHPSGQSMYQAQLLGSISGTLTLRPPLNAGSSLLIFPPGITDFTATGGPGHVVRQSTPGGAFVVSQLTLGEISGTASLCSTAALCPGYQAALGFTPEDISNKSSSLVLGTSHTQYPTQGAVKSYVDTGLAGKQAALGFTPEDVANKAASALLGTSTTAYPTQGAVKSYVDTGLAGKQASLGFTPEDVANKATATSLGASNTAYPTQNAVKSYVDAGLAGKQSVVTWGAGLIDAAGVAAVLSTESGFLTNGGATGLSCSAGTAGRAQVMANGEWQYCDGAAIPLLRSGVPTQSGLHWNVTVSSCTTDANAGKLTVTASGEVQCASDIGGDPGPGGAVTSVFGRTGAVVAQSGDFSAAQVTNAADKTAANTFTHAAGQTMARLMLTGATSGTLSFRPPAVAGTSILTWPAGTTDFTATGGPGQVVRQSTLGGALLVSPLTLSDLSGTATLCHTSPVCAGYQAALGFTPEDSASKTPNPALGTSNTAYPTQGAVKAYVDAGLSLKQASLGFTPEDVANKAPAPGLGTSNTQYPTQGAVKAYVDTGLAGKQNSLGFVAENVANKATTTALGTSDVAYPSQNAVKVYVDTGLGTKQNTLLFTPEDVANKATSAVLGTSNTAYPSQGAVKAYVDAGLATKQNSLGFTAVPDTARVWTDRAEASLVQEVNLGVLGSGLLRHSVSGGVSTPTAAELSGAVTTAGSNVTALAPNSVAAANVVDNTITYAKLQDVSAASRLLGRGAAAGAGDPQEITLGANLSMSGTTLNAAGASGVADGDKNDITVSGSGTIWTIDNAAVTYAKLQDVSAASRLLGRGSAAGAGDPQELTLGPNCTMTGTVFNCTGGVGGGDVSVSGTPAMDQLAIWVNPTTITGTSTLSLNVTDFDVGAAVRTRPNKVGTTPPATCQVGDTFYDSDAAVSQKLLACETAPSGWAPVGGAGVGSGDVAVSGTPSMNQLAIWTDATTITGTSAISLNVTEFDVATATRTRPNKTGTTPPVTCTDGDTFWDSDAAAGSRLLDCHTNVWTPQGGGSGTISGGVAGRATVYTSATTVDDSTAITMDDTDVLTYSPKVIPIAASMTAGVHNVVACTSGAGTVVMTLQPTASTPAKRYTLVKVDTGAGLCRVAPATGEQINWIVDGPQDAVRRGDTVIVTVIAAGQWYAELGLSAESLATLPQVRSFDVGAGGLDVSGGCTVSNPAVLLAGGPKVPSIACTDADTDALEFSYNSAKGWNAGTLVLELSVFYSGTTHNAQVFGMNFSGQCVSAGDVVATWAITSGATAESTANVQALVTASAVGNRVLKGVTAPLTLAGTCAPGDTVFIHGLVDAAVTTAGLLPDLKILGVKVTWTRTGSDT